MTTKQGKILSHPNRDQIISKLSAGESSRAVAKWLSAKYPNEKTYHISFSTLDEFRRKSLNIHGTVLQDLKNKIREQETEEMDDELTHVVKRNKTYNKKLTEIVDTQIDWRNKLIGFLNVVEARCEYLYNDITQNNPDSYKKDRLLLEYVEKMLHMVQEIRKIEGAPDQIVQHNVTVQAIDQHSTAFQMAIQETVAELDTQIASMLMEKITSKLEKMTVKDENLLYSQADMDKIETIEANLLPKTSEINE